MITVAVRRLVAVVALFVLLAACSTASPGPTADPSLTPGKAPGVKQLPTAIQTGPEEEPGHSGEGETGGPHAGEPPGARHASEKYSRENPPPSGFRRADSGESRSGNERLDLLVKIEPPCVEMGDFVTFTAKTKPGVDVAFLTNIPDAQGRAREEAGVADAQGLFTWVLAVPTNIREDQYTLFAAAADSQGTDGGISGTWFHYVAIPNACP